MRRRSFFFVPFVVMLTIAPACGSFSENDVPGDGGPPSAEAAVGEAGLDAAAEAGEGGSSETGAVEAPLELAAAQRDPRARSSSSGRSSTGAT
jgi:hypothetical protein